MSIDFDTLTQVRETQGDSPAIEWLISDLRRSGDFQALFYSMLLKARAELGVSPFPTGPSSELPPETHEPYEEAIRAAAREVGGLYLAKNDLPRAWGYFRLIQEPKPVQDALDRYQPGPDEDIYPLLDIAWHQRVHADRGFELLLERLGICSAITTLGSTDLSADQPLKLRCVRRLIFALHAQLRERMGTGPESSGVPFMKLLESVPYGEELYLIDVSHLSSIVQMSLELPVGDESLAEARELCAYGTRLAESLQGGGDPPFENSYVDYAVILAILAGENVEVGLKHFEDKIAPGLLEGNTFPAEVYVNLLLKLNRIQDALTAARQFLSDIPEESTLTCPGILELARQAGDFPVLAEAARQKGDAVTFLAALMSTAKPQ